MTQLVPSARALIRAEEWLIRRVDPAAEGGSLLSCDGISDLVRDQAALSLTALEGDIEVLEPVETFLVPDESPIYNATTLYLESQRRCTVPNDTARHVHFSSMQRSIRFQFH